MSHNKPVPPALAEFAIGERAELLATIARYETTADNCEVLRARLAKYEDADGVSLMNAGGMDERAAFEAWARKHNSSLSEDEIDQPEDINLDKQAGVYIWANAESAWMAWKARAAFSGLNSSIVSADAARTFIDSERMCSDCQSSEICCRPLLRAAKLELETAPSHGEQVRQMVPSWNLAADELPASGKTVLAFYLNSHGMGRRIRAMHVKRFTVEAEEFADPDTQCCEYSEQDDCYYTTEGWYELIDNWPDYSSCTVIEGVVTHWMPLPSTPSAGSQEQGE